MDKTSAYLGIDDNRLQHMREVGRLCLELARDIFGWNETECRQMFVIGFLHDTGYEFATHQSEHEEIGGQLLGSLNFLGADTILRHGDPDADMDDDRLLILNIADMTVSSNGHRVGFETRLKDIAARYGAKSTQYVRAKQVIEAISEQLRQRKLALHVWQEN